MSAKKRINILIVPPSSGDTVQLTIPPAVVYLSCFSLICLVFLVGFLALDYFGERHAAQQLQSLQAENAFLQSRLAGMRSSMSTIGSYLEEIQQTDEQIRLVFGFPSTDPAERALGIGGFPKDGAVEESGYKQLSFETEAHLDHLVRQAQFERQNFHFIYDSLLAHREQLDHTPAIRPCEGYFSSGYGMRRDPFTGRRRMHPGCDFAGPVGTPIRAPAQGTVSKIYYDRGMGKTLVIDHGFGIETSYGHLQKVKVEVGQQVVRGDTIAFMGNTGSRSTGPHLHYEVWVQGHTVNPLDYIYN